MQDQIARKCSCLPIGSTLSFRITAPSGADDGDAFVMREA